VKRAPPKGKGQYDGERRRGEYTFSRYQWYATGGRDSKGEWRKLDDPPPKVKPDEKFKKAQERQTKGSSQYVKSPKSSTFPQSSGKGSKSRPRTPSPEPPFISDNARFAAGSQIIEENDDRVFRGVRAYNPQEEADRRRELELYYAEEEQYAARTPSIELFTGGRDAPPGTQRQRTPPPPDGGAVQSGAIWS
jgi:hypothetical protein